MNKKLIIFLTGLMILVLACGGTAPTTAPDQSVETVVAATLQAVTQEAANHPTQPSGIPVSFQNVSIVIPNGLATGADSQLMPAADESVGGPWGVAPEYIEFVLSGYPVSNQYFQPVIQIYPAQEYAAVNSWAQSSLTRLQGVLASPDMPLTNDSLPTVPFNGAAAQQYAAQAKLISFNGGNGVRMLSQYAQYPAPITKTGSFYHYEGLTSDGKYMIAALFPIILPLQATFDNPSADGITYPSDRTDEAAYNTYFQSITDKLNASSSDSFQPDLTQLDMLIQSITVTP